MKPVDAGGEVTALKIARRLGSTPLERGSGQGMSCPDVFELASGDIAIIGTDQTAELDNQLAEINASRATYERTVVIPRQVLMDVIQHLHREP